MSQTDHHAHKAQSSRNERQHMTSVHRRYLSSSNCTKLVNCADDRMAEEPRSGSTTTRQPRLTKNRMNMEYNRNHQSSSNIDLASSCIKLLDDERPLDREEEPEQMSLTQMVDIDASDMQLSVEDERLRINMQRQRVNLENYVNGKTTRYHFHKKHKLVEMINMWAREARLSPAFVSAMHTIRDYGNKASHGSQSLPRKEECQRAVNHYLRLKQLWEDESSSRRRR
mmetsp:Transcript_31395/g.65550  ORF Transcript_31395/g.65550 Transcript_31395/m.65550 type:complete len:226 (+) Transcript_31395:1097-1774(+)